MTTSLTPKEDSFWVDNDIVTLVYKINVHNRYQNFNDEVYEDDNSYYWYISFKNVSVDGNGNVANGLNSYDSAEERSPSTPACSSSASATPR